MARKTGWIVLRPNGKPLTDTFRTAAQAAISALGSIDPWQTTKEKGFRVVPATLTWQIASVPDLMTRLERRIGNCETIIPDELGIPARCGLDTPRLCVWCTEDRALLAEIEGGEG